ncbi:MAG TPA: hypothetical protein VGL63_12800 [Streptosporangiaceae bacterium]|jgi:uncharacterized membrane protein YidH (DUF202 family)
MTSSNDPEDVDPVSSRARTKLAWTRAAIAFAALGVAVLKTNVAAGLTVIALTPLVWHIGRLSQGGPGGAGGKSRPRQLLLISVAVAAVAVTVLVLVILGHGRSSGFHPPRG